MINSTDPNGKGKIQFIQYHQPALADGTYEITVSQTVTAKGIDANNSFTKSLTFVVQGNRFDLNPQDIHAVFPPAGSSGDHSNVLPHIVLKRSTLPWERESQKGKKDVPWLALILIHEGEMTQSEGIKIVPLSDLTTASTSNIKWPGVTLETGQHENDKVAVIDVPKALLSVILPSLEDLQYLAHVRQVTDQITTDQITTDNEPLAVVISNRLPKKDGNSTAYLVSLENRYDDSGQFNFQGDNGTDSIRLVVLKSWSFACIDAKQNFKRLLTHLNRGQFLFSIEDKDTKISDLISNLSSKNLNSEKIEKLLSFLTNKVPPSNPELQVDEEGILWRIISRDSQQYSSRDSQQYSIEKVKVSEKIDRLDIYLRQPSTLRLPKCDNNGDAEKYLSMGYLPLPHFLRQGGKTFSWYHSPLLPANNPTGINLSQLSIRCADQLLSYDPTNGLFDTSYAAAWQLGQLLALQDKSFAINLFNWKRSNAQKLAKESQLALYPHLFATPASKVSDGIEFPNDINTWFEQLGLLKGVPFHYLVPDDRMLPPESIRFFWLDWFWVESLIDGAFSIGRVRESDANQDSQNNLLSGTPKIITGFIMRSEVVSGWPDLQIDGLPDAATDPKQNPLKVLRCDRLSESVLICLFDGEIKTVDISLKPEGLHFGFTEKLAQDLRYLTQDLRYLSNGEIILDLTVNLIWKHEDRRVANINALADKMADMPIISSTEKQSPKQKGQSFTSAQFALEMVQGAEKVRFQM